MSEISTPVQATLPDYEQAPVSSVDPGLFLFYASHSFLVFLHWVCNMFFLPTWLDV